RARYQPAQFDCRFRRNRDPVRLAAGDEFIDLAERARMIRRLAMVDRAKYEISRALERRSFCRDAGGRARLADKTAVGLRIFVDAVATQRQERRPWRHFAFPLIKPAQEGAATVELVAEAFVPIEDAVVGRAAQHGVADVRSPAVLDMVANGIAAARIA